VSGLRNATSFDVFRGARLPVTVVLVCMFLAGCGRPAKPAGKTSPAPVERYQLHGEVVRLDPEAHAAVTKHQKIEGWMAAMTMEFPVKDEAEYKELHPGDQITATVFVQDLDFWIGEIRHEGK
jgi:protein SCO1/2